jgi:hypothetical protein
MEDTQDELLARVLDSTANLKIDSDEQHAIIAHDLKSAMRQAVGWSNFYFEL